MVSHDCVAFYLLSEEVSKHVKVVQSGQGADEIFAGYSWYPPLAGVPRDRGRRRVRRGSSSTGRTPTLARQLNPDWLVDARRQPGVRGGRTSAGPAPTDSVDAALRLDSQVMLVDDPVKRVDNMTMAWGLEARVPFLDHELVELAAACPPELKLAAGRQGRAQGRRAWGGAGRGDRPAQGLLPGSGHPAPGGPDAGEGSRRACPHRRRATEVCSARSTLTRCWRTRTLLVRRSAPTSCGSSRCWRCGCRTRGSSKAKEDLDDRSAQPCRRHRTAGGVDESGRGLLPSEVSGSWSPALSPDGGTRRTSPTAAARPRSGCSRSAAS